MLHVYVCKGNPPHVLLTELPSLEKRADPDGESPCQNIESYFTLLQQLQATQIPFRSHARHAPTLIPLHPTHIGRPVNALRCLTPVQVSRGQGLEEHVLFAHIWNLMQ